MSTPVNISIAVPDPDVDPKTFTESCAALAPLLSADVEITGNTFIFGPDVPGVDDQDKMWFRTNSIGSLIGAHVFHLGVWVREEPLVSARFGYFSGDPTNLFDATGRGLKGPGPVALDYWGWALTNGNNGTQNLSNRFIILGAMDNAGIVGFDDGDWRTNINGEAEKSGGVAEITLDADNTYNAGILVGEHDATGSAVGGPLYGATTGTSDTTIGTVNTDPQTISVVNPFVALGFIQFVGYV